MVYLKCSYLSCLCSNYSGYQDTNRNRSINIPTQQASVDHSNNGEEVCCSKCGDPAKKYVCNTHLLILSLHTKENNVSIYHCRSKYTCFYKG